MTQETRYTYHSMAGASTADHPELHESTISSWPGSDVDACLGMAPKRGHGQLRNVPAVYTSLAIPIPAGVPNPDAD